MTKECENHENKNRSFICHIFFGILAFIILTFLAIFITWIFLRPNKPTFILEDVRIFAFNLTSTGETPPPTTPTLNTVTLTFQVTLSSSNPNKKTGIYYTKLDAYATYRGQQISLASGLPDTYQTHGDISVWSPMLYGLAVPFSPYLSEILRQDLTSGGVLFNVKLNGRVKWRFGSLVFGRNHIDVNCPAFIPFAGVKDSHGFGVSDPVKFQLSKSCVVDL